ncbi:DUF5615 family PIN-like protein [Nostocales cyanobacterium LEGE 11386]|nr:DUF5615 family PIN-like protein [Nostocales cyanobacterium LEGE 11386]
MTVVRFQADADLKQAILTGTIRKQPNIDFQSANTAGLEGKKDQDVLEIAASEGRVLVTHDRKTMPAEFGQFIVSQTSTGVLIVSQNLPTSDAIDALILIWEASTAEEWFNQIMSIPF